MADVRWEQHPEGLLFYLHGDVRALVAFRTTTMHKVTLWSETAMTSPDVGDLNRASFRKRLSKAAAEAFGLDEVVARGVEHDLGGSPSRWRSNSKTVTAELVRRSPIYSRGSAALRSRNSWPSTARRQNSSTTPTRKPTPPSRSADTGRPTRCARRHTRTGCVIGTSSARRRPETTIRRRRGRRL